MFSPPLMIISFILPTIWPYPCLSITAVSLEKTNEWNIIGTKQKKHQFWEKFTQCGTSGLVQWPPQFWPCPPSTPALSSTRESPTHPWIKLEMSSNCRIQALSLCLKQCNGAQRQQSETSLIKNTNQCNVAQNQMIKKTDLHSCLNNVALGVHNCNLGNNNSSDGAEREPQHG